MASDAAKCIQALDDQQQDITMLWMLKKPSWLIQFKAGRDLYDWARNIMHVSEAAMTSKDFQGEVFRVFAERGIRAVAPQRVVANWQKNTAKEMCLQERWPKPFFPIMLQAKRAPDQQGSGAFIVFSSWQDAMIALREMAKTKTYYYAKGKKAYLASMVYENQLTDMEGYDYPCRIILDCDAKEAQFEHRFTLQQLVKCIEEVPTWFTRELIRIGAIKPTDEVVVYEKEKSRKGKASRHYIFHIVGLSTWDIQAVLRAVFLPYLQADASDSRKRKRPEPDTPEPWQVTDTVPHHGRGQYSVLGFFDERKGETECPAITRRLVIVNGEITKTGMCRISRKDASLEGSKALDLLHRACYTCPVFDFVTLDPKFMTQRQVTDCLLCLPRGSNSQTPKRWQAKNGLGGAPRAGPSAARGGTRSLKSAFLPEWIVSAMAKITGHTGGYNINTTMHCLEHVHSHISGYVQDIKREDVAHISRALFCPCLACKGVFRVHESNGTFVAVAEGGKILYARCSDRTCLCDKEDMEESYLEVVERSGSRPWIKLTEESMEHLESVALRTKKDSSFALASTRKHRKNL
jgi:hypothetical protein